MKTMDPWLSRILEGPVGPDELAPIFPWAGAMIGCPHDPVFHSEGDPWVHTGMVAAELEKTDGFQDLPRARQDILRLGVWMHDIAKPATTIIEFDEELGRERVRQPGHAPLGAAMAWQGLIDAGCDPVVARDVHALVFWHQRPSHFHEELTRFDEAAGKRVKVGMNEKPSVMRRVVRFGHEVTETTWSDLLRLCMADQRGRLVDGAPASTDELELAGMMIEELGQGADADLLERPWPFGTLTSRLEYLRDPKGERSAFYTAPERPDAPRLIVLSGLPGAGKNTLIERDFSDLPVISFDDLRDEMKLDIGDNQGRMIQEAFNRLRVHLRAGQDVVWNATCLSRRARQKVVGLGHDYGACVEVHSIDVPVGLAIARNARRDEPVPEHVIAKMANNREPAMPDEAHRIFSYDKDLSPREMLALRLPVADPSPDLA